MTKFLATAAVLVGAAVTSVRAQPLAKQSEDGAYAVPFASESNRIELEVVNSTDDQLSNVTIELKASPTWLSFEATSTAIGSLEPGEAGVATFIFDQDEKAPVGEIASIEFDVVSSRSRLVGGGIPRPDRSGVRDEELRQFEMRTILIEPEAPKELTLRGNYPNPFNPSTKIAYGLPAEANVEIEVYNAIGQRVTHLMDNLQAAGYQEALWNASSFPSGVYFYSISMKTNAERSVKFGKMLLVK